MVQNEEDQKSYFILTQFLNELCENKIFWHAINPQDKKQ